MKAAIMLVFCSTLLLVSQQQRLPLQTYGQAFPSWNYRPSINDIYDYLYARSLLQQLSHPVPEQVNVANKVPTVSSEQLPDALSRNTGALIIDEIPTQDGRFLFNFVTTIGTSSPTYNFLKTVYYVSSSTATTTFVTTCIPALSFSDTQYTVVCRKRRDVLEMLLTGDESPEMASELQQELAKSPSKVLPMEPTADARSWDPRSLGDDAILVPAEIASSKTEDFLVEHGYFTPTELSREKRFLVASSTITTYAFVTRTTTKTLSNVGTSLLCLPSQYGLC